MTPEPEHLWTIDDVAAYCKVRPSVVRYWIRTTDMPFIRLGKQHRFDPRDIREWIEARKQGNNGSRLGPLKPIS